MKYPLTDIPDDDLIRAAWEAGELGFLVTEAQYPIYEAFRSGRFHRISMHMTRRGGKDVLCAIWACEIAIQVKNSFTYHYHHNYTVGRDIFTDTMTMVLRTCPDDLKPTQNLSTAKYVWPNGSENRIKGVGTGRDIKAGRGARASALFVTEAGLYEHLPDVIETNAPLMVNQKPGIMVLQTNKALTEDHEFYTYLDEDKTTGAGFEQDIYHTSHISPDEIETLAEQLGGKHSDSFKIECLLARIGVKERLVTPGFAQRAHDPWVSEKVNVRGPDEAPEFVEVVRKPLPTETAMEPLVRELDWAGHYYGTAIAVDYGFKPDHTGILFAKARNGVLYIVGEGDLIEAHYEEVAATLTELNRDHFTEYYEWLRITHPAEHGELKRHVQYQDGDSRSSAKVASLGWSLGQAANRDPRSRDAEINVLIAHGRLVVHPDCTNLIKQLKTGKYNSSFTSYERTKQFGHNDLLSALQILVTHMDLYPRIIPRVPAHAVNNVNVFLPPDVEQEGMDL